MATGASYWRFYSFFRLRRIFMEIKILDAMKSLHMLRLHRIKDENGGGKRHENSCMLSDENDRRRKTSEFNMIFVNARLIINCWISHSNDNDVWCRAKMTVFISENYSHFVAPLLRPSFSSFQHLKVKVFLHWTLNRSSESLKQAWIIQRLVRERERRVNKLNDIVFGMWTNRKMNKTKTWYCICRTFQANDN